MLMPANLILSYYYYYYYYYCYRYSIRMITQGWMISTGILKDWSFQPSADSILIGYMDESSSSWSSGSS